MLRVLGFIFEFIGERLQLGLERSLLVRRHEHAAARPLLELVAFRLERALLSRQTFERLLDARRFTERFADAENSRTLAESIENRENARHLDSERNQTMPIFNIFSGYMQSIESKSAV